MKYFSLKKVVKLSLFANEVAQTRKYYFRSSTVLLPSKVILTVPENNKNTALILILILLHPSTIHSCVISRKAGAFNWGGGSAWSPPLITGLTYKDERLIQRNLWLLVGFQLGLMIPPLHHYTADHCGTQLLQEGDNHWISPHCTTVLSSQT